MKRFYFLCVVLFFSFYSEAQFAEKSKNYENFKGLFHFLYDEKKDKIFLEVKNLKEEFLYVYSLSNGIGSNDIGLDRGQLGNEQVVYFEKAGNKLLLIQPNLKYRAITNNVLEKKSVEQAFAKSVLFGFEIVEEKNGVYVIDITKFLMQDTHGVESRLSNLEQGNYSLDFSKSAFDMERTKAFPNNIEFDAILTFTGEAKGTHVRSVVPNANIITVSQHHSFIALPDNQYKERAFDPRSGSNLFSYYDYATPVQESILKRYISRHRLEKKNKNAAISEAIEPIIYYLDNGTPEPVRSALLEGGKWWNQAFEAIGYKNAFQLKILPDDADPMDVRYNVIQWVHRSTRGWSYGRSIKDPRTGEIIKGHVSLGSLRIRQDFLIAQALMDKPFAEREDNYQPMLDLAIARIKQLSAHEIGHTLGFAHNFAASTKGKSSVMDYPHPQFSIKENKIDFSNAYASGIGEWDKVTVAYSYTEFTEGKNEKEGLNEILKSAQEQGLRYISDQDARPAGGAHALAHLWDNGKSVSEELEQMLKIRALGIEQFSVDNIKQGEAYSSLEDVFAPLYFFHRYQAEAVSKVIGGLDYNYAVKGDGQFTVKVIPKKEQVKALNTILKTLNASVIAIPEDKLALFPPRAIGYNKSRESLQGKAGVAFDPLSAAETASDMTLRFLLHPERASRLIQQKATNSDNLGLSQVLTELINKTLKKQHKDVYFKEIQNTINYKVLQYIMQLAASKDVHAQVNALAYLKLEELQKMFQIKKDANSLEMYRRITHFKENAEDFIVLKSPKIPDGSPIGMDCIH